MIFQEMARARKLRGTGDKFAFYFCGGQIYHFSVVLTKISKNDIFNENR